MLTTQYVSSLILIELTKLTKTTNVNLVAAK